MASTGTPFPTSTDNPGGTTLGSETDRTMTGGTSYSSDESLGSTSSASAMGRERMDRVVQGAHQVVDNLAAKAAPLVDRFGGRVDDASGSLHDRADQLSAMQEEWMDTARTTVREHPIASIAAAVAVGMLISRLSR